MVSVISFLTLIQTNSMKKTLLLLFIFYSSFIQAQNLVPNGDFELGPDSSSAGWSIGNWDTLCSPTVLVSGPNLWITSLSSPDRLVEIDLPLCNWDFDTAQSGKAWVDFGMDEAGKTTLIEPLFKDSIYNLSFYYKLETFNGLSLFPLHLQFKFNNNGNTFILNASNINNWLYFDTTFISIENSSELEIKGIIDINYSAVKVDNITLIKKTNTTIGEEILSDNKFEIFPMPIIDKVYFKFIPKNTNLIAINDLSGKNIIIFGKDSLISNTMDLSFLKAGFYFIQIRTDKETLVKKILISK
jgi:hypothetical protein